MENPVSIDCHRGIGDTKYTNDLKTATDKVKAKGEEVKKLNEEKIKEVDAAKKAAIDTKIVTAEKEFVDALKAELEIHNKHKEAIKDDLVKFEKEFNEHKDDAEKKKKFEDLKKVSDDLEKRVAEITKLTTPAVTEKKEAPK